MAVGRPAAAIAGFALFGARLSCMFPLLLSAAGNADPHRPARGIARVAGLGYVGMLGGPVLIGGLASLLGLTAALSVPVVLALVVAAGAGVVAPRDRARTGRLAGDLTALLAEQPPARSYQLAWPGPQDPAAYGAIRGGFDSSGLATFQTAARPSGLVNSDLSPISTSWISRT